MALPRDREALKSRFKVCILSFPNLEMLICKTGTSLMKGAAWLRSTAWIFVKVSPRLQISAFMRISSHKSAFRWMRHDF